MLRNIVLLLVVASLLLVIGLTLVTWYQSSQEPGLDQLQGSELSELTTDEINIYVNIFSLLDHADSLVEKGHLAQAMETYQLMFEGIDIVLTEDQISAEAKDYMRERFSPRYQLMAYEIMIFAAQANALGERTIALGLMDRAYHFLEMAKALNSKDPELKQGYEDWEKTRQSIEDTDPVLPKPSSRPHAPVQTI